MISAKTAGLSAIAVSGLTVAFVISQMHQFMGSVSLVKQRLAVHMDEFRIIQVILLIYIQFYN